MRSEPTDAQILKELSADFQQRRYKVREPQRLMDVLSQLMAKRGYAQERSVVELEETWRLIVGSQFDAFTRPGLVRRGVLELFVANSAIMQEMTFRKREFLDQLATRLPHRKIRDLRFKVGAVR